MTKPITIDWFHQFAAMRGGMCLSTEYKNLNDMLSYRCALGHLWLSRARNARSNGSWCSICVLKRNG